MANNHHILKSNMLWMNTLWEQFGDPRLRELVIMASARAKESEYEWHQHVSIGRRVGLSDAEILAIESGDYEGFEARETAALRYADAVVTGDVDDATHEVIAEWFDDGEVVALAMLLGSYAATALFIDALDIEPREPFVGWRLENDEGI
jgi:alkylhydroperoxidase family enzyme